MNKILFALPLCLLMFCAANSFAAEEVTLKGWLYNLRSSGKLMFPQLRDGTGIVQCVVARNSVTPELWEALKPLGQESALIVTGRVREDARAPGGFEIDVSDAQVVQNAHDFPITPKEHGPEFLLDHRHLWIRSKKQHAILKVRHTVVKAVRDFLDLDGFTLVKELNEHPETRTIPVLVLTGGPGGGGPGPPLMGRPDQVADHLHRRMSGLNQAPGMWRR